EVIEVPADSPSPAPLAAPAEVPSLSSLAAALDAELGDSFVPTPQPRRESPAPLPVQPPASAAGAATPYTPPAAPYTPAYASQTSAPQPQPSRDVVPHITAEAGAVLAPSVFGDLLQN